MQYAIIDGENRLQAVFDAPRNEPFSWTGNDPSYRVLAASSFALYDGYDYGDHVWNGHEFELAPDAVRY